MKKKLLIGAALILSVGTACTSGAGDWQSYSGDKRIEERVDSVLALMTLEEKIGQMTQYSAKSDIVTGPQVNTYNPQIQISVVSGTKRSIFRQKNKTKRSKKKAAHNTYKAGAKG